MSTKMFVTGFSLGVLGIIGIAYHYIIKKRQQHEVHHVNIKEDAQDDDGMEKSEIEKLEKGVKINEIDSNKNYTQQRLKSFEDTKVLNGMKGTYATHIKRSGSENQTPFYEASNTPLHFQQSIIRKRLEFCERKKSFTVNKVLKSQSPTTNFANDDGMKRSDNAELERGVKITKMYSNKNGTKRRLKYFKDHTKVHKRYATHIKRSGSENTIPYYEDLPNTPLHVHKSTNSSA